MQLLEGQPVYVFGLSGDYMYQLRSMIQLIKILKKSNFNNPRIPLAQYGKMWVSLISTEHFDRAFSVSKHDR